MPNRMLRDWTRSEKVNGIDPLAERFFVRLIMKADDHGCYYGDTRLLKADLFPLLLDTVREADISRWMAACQKAGLIVLYEREGKKYLQIIDFRQRLDKARSKFPLPDYNDFPELVNDFPAETETETETENEDRGAPTTPPPDPVGKEKKKNRRSFNPPSQIELQDYFILKIGKTKGEDRARIMADSCLDHYEANGWVQGKNKPIVDWKAAARNWVRREMSGDFSNNAPARKVDEKQRPPAQTLPPPTPKPVEKQLSEAEKLAQTRDFIEDLFQDYLSGTLRPEFISGAAFDFLRNKEGLLKISPEELVSIAARAKEKRTAELKGSQDVADKKLLESLQQDPQLWKKDAAYQRHAKTISLLEFFEQVKNQNRKKIFE